MGNSQSHGRTRLSPLCGYYDDDTLAGGYEITRTYDDNGDITAVSVDPITDPILSMLIWSAVDSPEHTLQFTDASFGTNPAVSWAWNFGDGNTSTTQNPLHTYASAGTYELVLTVTDGSGNSHGLMQRTCCHRFMVSRAVRLRFGVGIMGGVLMCRHVTT